MKNAKVLVVEDEGIVAHDIAGRLKDMGYDVVATAYSGEDAIDKAGELHPELVLMDIVLAGKMDGIETADIIRSRWDIPVIFLTAYADQKRLERAKLVYPFGYIIKPFQGNDLKAAVEIGLYIYRVDRERRKAVEEMRNSEERYQSLFEQASDGIFILDINAKILSINKSFADMHGFTVQEVLSMGLSGLDVEGTSRVPERLRRIMTGETIAFDVEHYHKDGHTFPLSVKANLVSLRANQFIMSIHRDISERRRAENALRLSQEQMRALARRLQEVREEERTQIAREIHDELGGALTGLKIDVSFLIRSAAGIENEATRTSLLAGIDTMNTSIDPIIQAVRRIAMALRPGILDDLGLVAALEWQLNDFEKRTGIRCEFFPPAEDISLDADRSTALFRIFQEALTNVVRHSGATEVRVRLRKDAACTALEVEDNGQGIEIEKANSKESLGLLGMMERAQMFGGSITVSGTPGTGTKVTVEIPP